MKMNLKDVLATIFVFVCFSVFAFAFAMVFHGRNSGEVTTDTIRIEKTDTMYIIHRDTIPQMVSEKIIKYVAVPQIIEAADTTKQDSLPVVQKVFSDSTYTAYVSGIKYDDLPKLDSIIVSQRTIYHTIQTTITNTKKVRRKFGIGVQGGYGITPKGFQPYVGIGVSYNLF